MLAVFNRHFVHMQQSNFVSLCDSERLSMLSEPKLYVKFNLQTTPSIVIQDCTCAKHSRASSLPGRYLTLRKVVIHEEEEALELFVKY